MLKIKEYFINEKLWNLAGDSFWTLFSQVFVAIINVLSVYILANMLLVHHYGEFKFVTTWLAIAIGVGYTGYNYLLPQKISKGEKYNLNKIFRETFIKSLPTFVGLFILSIYYFYNGNLNLSSGFFFASLLAPILCISVIVNLYYMGKRNFKMFALAQNFVDAIQLIVLAFFAYFSENFILIISAYFLATIIANLLIIAKVLQEERKEKLNNIIEDKIQAESYTESHAEHSMKSKLNVSGIILGFTNQIDKLLIFHILGGVSLAIYSIATAIGDQARTPIKALSSAIFPRMTSQEFTKKKLFVTFFVLTIVSIFITFVLILIYPFIFSNFFPKYESYIFYASLATLSVIFAPVTLLYLYLQSKNDFVSINNYAHINSFLQVFLFSLAAYLGSVLLFIVFRILILVISNFYLTYKIYKF